MPTNWTDNPITTTTPIKAVHINELRIAVNSLRQSAGLHEIDWTDDPIISGVTRIRAIHFNEAAGAIQDLWFRRSLGRVPSWSAGPPPSPSRTLRASDVNNLRSWVNTYEEAVGLDPQGIDSLTFDPSPPGATGTAIITQEWVNSAIQLGTNLPTQPRLLIRANMKSRESDNAFFGFKEQYKNAINLWYSNDFIVTALFTSEFNRWEKIDNGNTLYHANHKLDDWDGKANHYIIDYAGKLGQFAYEMKSTGIKSFWLWNEANRDGIISPGNYNVDDRSLAPQIFGALLYQASYAIRSEIPDATIYAGAFALQDVGNWDEVIDGVVAYMQVMYDYMEDHGMSVNSGVFGYGWDAISINIEGIFDLVYPQKSKRSGTPGSMI